MSPDGRFEAGAVAGAGAQREKPPADTWWKTWLRRAALVLCCLYILPLLLTGGWSIASGWPESWRTADWSSTRTAPDPATQTEAIVQVYAARAGQWKGIFSVHTWIAFKPENAPHFNRFEVVGWGPPLRFNKYPPDGFWFGNTPEVIREVRGDFAAALIPKIQSAVERYPYRHRGAYSVWPGPNSNTFVAWVGREVPEMMLEMPATALGKDYLGDGVYLQRTPSGSGWQWSLWGVLGMAVGVREGIEIHFMGTTVGLDFDDVGIKLPGVGTIGLLTTLANT